MTSSIARALLASLALLSAWHAAAQAPTDNPDARRLHALFDRHWEESAQRFPEWATFRGDHRFGDRFADSSAAGRASHDAWALAMLREAESLPADKLSATDRVSRELFIHDLADEVRMQRYAGWRSRSLTSSFGFQTRLAGLLQASPTSSATEVRQMLARLAAYPARVDQELAHLREGLAAGWVAPREVLERVVQQIDGQLPAQPADSPFYAPFKTLGAGIPPTEQDELRSLARQAVAQHVYPAQRKLRAFVVDECLARAPPDGALSRYPDGGAVYAELVRQHTNTELSPQQIHDIGLQQLARLRVEMEATQRAGGFTGDFAAYVRHLNSDAKYFLGSAEALLARYRDIGKRIEPELPKLFAELPRAPWGVRAIPAHLGPGAAAYYSRPSLDGRRAGWFYANVQDPAKSPTWAMETLVAHEAVPGHHLHLARATELTGLPAFRRSFGSTAFNEGWALYAETLGSQLGLYVDAESRFGHLQWQAFRAARLVVDTGVHALGWTRQRAIDYMAERTGVDRGRVTAEVDRYYSNPGQALAYMIGQLKIVELRDRAQARLGAQFDIRRFHNALIDQGSVPLPVLERMVDEWIAQQAKP